jgi:hypothetical protein
MKRSALFLLLMFMAMITIGQKTRLIMVDSIKPYPVVSDSVINVLADTLKVNGNLKVTGKIVSSSTDTAILGPTNFDGAIEVTGGITTDSAIVLGPAEIGGTLTVDSGISVRAGGGSIASTIGTFSVTDFGSTSTGIGSYITSGSHSWLNGIFNMAAFGMTTRTFLAGYLNGTANNRFFRADSVQIGMQGKNKDGHTFSAGITENDLYLNSGTSIFTISDTGAFAGQWHFKRGSVKIQNSLTWDESATGTNLELYGYFSGNTIDVSDSISAPKVVVDTLVAGYLDAPSAIDIGSLTPNLAASVSLSLSHAETYVSFPEETTDAMTININNSSSVPLGYKIYIRFGTYETATVTFQTGFQNIMFEGTSGYKNWIATFVKCNTRSGNMFVCISHYQIPE